jgi:hypothetical protein
MRRLLTTVVAASILFGIPALTAENLNEDLEGMCKPMRELNVELGASAAPGSPIGAMMQKELSLSPSQYGALWSLLKITPTTNCRGMY